MNEFIKIIDVDYQGDFTFALTFNNACTKHINLKPFLKGEVFEPLNKEENLIQYGLINGTLEWYNGADFAPEFLYAEAE